MEKVIKQRSIKIRLALFTFILCASMPHIFAESADRSDAENHSFNVIPLGTSGGEFEDNISAYLVAPVQSNHWVAFDAGTVCSAIKNIPLQELQELNIKSHELLFTTYIKAYLISHAHLDHISGLVICSTTDNSKEIIGLPSTIRYLREYIFNWKIWPNMADEGKKPLLNKYHYHRLSINASYPIPNTTMSVKAFPLNHGNGYPSTAFLLEAQNHYLLYFGDTAPDAVEHSHDIQNIWQNIAPLIRKNRLNAIFIECSYPNGRPDHLLFGHLTPHWLLTELNELATIVNPQDPKSALKGLNIIVTHIKQGLEHEENGVKILQELKDKNDLGVKFILPQQGKRLLL